MRISDWSSDVCSSDLEKKKIISRLRGYHGVTVAAGSLTGLPYATVDFDLPIDRIKHAACPHYWREGKPDGSEERSEERRVGKEGVSRCRSRWLADHSKTRNAGINKRDKDPELG